ncbi:MAG: polymer-forming cytoskeletal protein [Acidobacteriota bacterium]|jgi:cytoskeletal protein CcmA (bactofilin family)
MFGNEMEKLKSFLGSGTEFQGELTARGILRMDGVVKGKIQADEVILSETAFIVGDIIAKKIIVGGKVEGNLRAQDLVEIKPNGNVKGDISTNKLLVIEGGEFNGQIEMGSDELTVLEIEPKKEVASV